MPTNRDFAEIHTLSEIIKIGYDALDENALTFLIGGAESEMTLLRNRQSLDALAFRPRVLREVLDIDMTTTFLGIDQRLPVFLAPIGGITQMDPGGTLSAVQAGGEFGVMGCISSVAKPDLEEVRAGSDAPAIFQIYVRDDDDWLLERLALAEKLNYQAFCITTDTAYNGRHERRLLNGSVVPGQGLGAGLEFQRTLSWDTVDLVRKNTKMPIILKGIATAEDAIMARDHGADVVYISNHGGRQLDHGAGAIDVLPEVVDAVGADMDVIIDSGFMRGTDIVKAIALGAKAVGLGKLYCFGLSAGGPAAVVRMLELLEVEIKWTMGLLGVTSLDQLDPSYLRAAVPARTAGLTSAHPHIDLPIPTYLNEG
jgi:glycolate oxidase